MAIKNKIIDQPLKISELENDIGYTRPNLFRNWYFGGAQVYVRTGNGPIYTDSALTNQIVGGTVDADRLVVEATHDYCRYEFEGASYYVSPDICYWKKGSFPIGKNENIQPITSAYQIWLNGWQIASYTVITVTPQGILLKDALQTEFSNTDFKDFPGYYTFSVLTADGHLASHTFEIDDSGYIKDTFNIAPTTGFNCYLVGWNDAVVHVRIYGGYDEDSNTSGYCYIAAKLEYGEGQTLAHLEDGVWVLNEIPNYEEEYLRCKAYKEDGFEWIGDAKDDWQSNPNLLDNWYFGGAEIYVKAGCSYFNDSWQPVGTFSVDTKITGHTGWAYYIVIDGSTYFIANNDLYQKSGTPPVNQRGQVVYSGTMNAYDRWVISNWNYDGGSNGCALSNKSYLTCQATDSWANNLRQVLDADKVASLCGKTVVFSALVRNTGVTRFIITINNVEHSVDATSSQDFRVVTVACAVPADANDIHVNIISAEAGYFDLIAVKLERGDTQTLAHRDDRGDWVLNEVPSYADEYAKCVQYDLWTGEYIGEDIANKITHISNPNLLCNSYFNDVSIMARAGSQYVNWNDGSDVKGTLNTDTVTTHYAGGYYNVVVDGNNYAVYNTYCYKKANTFPINRKGNIIYYGENSHIDGWSGKYTGYEGLTVISNEGMCISREAYQAHMWQFVPASALIGNTITASALVKDNSADAAHLYLICENQNGDNIKEVTASCASTVYSMLTATLTVPSGTTAVRVGILSGYDTGNQVCIKAVKLEVGEVQTLAHQDENGDWTLNEVPSYEEEYAKCCQYELTTGAYLGKNVTNFGLNPITSTDQDTTVFWGSLGPGQCMLNVHCTINQPSQYFMIHNLAYGDGEVAQFGFSQPNGPLYVRAGNTSGGWAYHWTQVYDAGHKPTLSDVGMMHNTVNGDFNDMTAPGWYWNQIPYCTGNIPPSGDYGFLEVIPSGDGGILQRWTDYDTGDLYYRCFVNGMWHHWMRAYTDRLKPSLAEIEAMPSYNRHGQAVNANEITETCFIRGTISPAPAGEDGQGDLLTIYYGGGWIKQMFFSAHNREDGYWIRQSGSSDINYGQWYSIYHDGRAPSLDKVINAGNMMPDNGCIKFTSTGADLSGTEPMSLSYQRLCCYSSLFINGNTDNSGNECVLITSCHGLSANHFDGLSIWSDNVQWKGNELYYNNREPSHLDTTGDQRTITKLPYDYYNKLEFKGISNAETLGNPFGDTSYYNVIGFGGWCDGSGPASYEIVTSANGRMSYHWGNTDGWYAWREVLTKQEGAIYNIDLNTITANGIVEVYQTDYTTDYHMPQGIIDQHYYLMTLYHIPEWIKQVAYDVRSNSMWIRGKYNNSWSGWERFINSEGGTFDGHVYLNAGCTIAYPQTLSVRHIEPMGDGLFLNYSDQKPVYINGNNLAIHTGNYGSYALPLGGGTMNGWITFAGVESGNSVGLTWNGSTDGASIYYSVLENDLGSLVLNTLDDSNARISFAANGSIHSYITTDGVFHGGVVQKLKVDSVDYNDTSYDHSYISSISNGAKIGLAAHWWHIIHLTHDNNDGYDAQLAVALNGGNVMYLRTSSGTTWNRWKNITSVAVNCTLGVNNWTQENDYWIQDISVSGLYADSNGVMSLTQNLPAAEIRAAASACLYAAMQWDGGMRVYAINEKPSMDIHITILITG